MTDNEYKHEKFDDCFLCGHPLVKFLLMCLLVFLGAFCAFYVIADWHFKKMLNPMYQMHKMEKQMMQDQKYVQRMIKKDFKRIFVPEVDPVRFVHVQQTPEAYRIMINLEPFDNNEKNIEVTSDENIVTVSAASAQTCGNKDKFFRFSQTFSFPEDAKTSKLTKIREGNNYIISVPIEED